MNRILACVLGDMDLLRPLGMAGIQCAAVARPGDPTLYSRFTAAAPEWRDSWKEPEGLLQRLLAFGAAQPQPPVLFFQEDRDLLMISRSRDRLAAYFRFILADPELVEDLVDKARFQDLARRLDLPVPPARRLDPACSAPESVDLRYPLLLKPLTRRREAWSPIGGRSKAALVPDRAALARAWPRMAAAGVEVLAQELVPGPEERIESYHVYMDAAGEIAGEFTGRKIRTLPVRFGYSTAVVITDSPDVAELGRFLARRLGLRGVAKFDFKRDPEGRLWLLEVNPRFNLWHHPGAAAGVNLPALVYRDLTGLPRPPARRVRAGVRWCCPWHDAAAARQAGLSGREWLRWLLSCETRSVLAADDPLPFLRGVLWRGLGRGALRPPGIPLPWGAKRPA